jgi:hypothetical protein
MYLFPQLAVTLLSGGQTRESHSIPVLLLLLLPCAITHYYQVWEVANQNIKRSRLFRGAIGTIVIAAVKLPLNISGCLLSQHTPFATITVP